MIKKNTNKTRILLIYLAITIILFGSSLYLTYAEPQGASESSSSVDTGPTTTPDSRTDDGGEIITLVLDLEQQNDAWKAYVGNVTGTYVLKNSNNNSIYEWPLGTTIEGEIYISRTSTVNFTTGAITCATPAEISTENTVFGFSSSATDTINGTFNATNHSTFQTGDNIISQNSCPSTALWVNDTVQTPTNTSVFQEVVLHDGASIVFAGIINNDKTGFENTTTYDFQAIIPENRSSTGTQYYFYLELGN